MSFHAQEGKQQFSGFIFTVCLTGRQFFTAEEMLFTAHHASYRESLDAGVHCFIMAIDVRQHVTTGCATV